MGLVEELEPEVELFKARVLELELLVQEQRQV